MPPKKKQLECCQWILSGKVQGVGFRPYVYRLAHKYKLQGWVRNNLGQVEIKAQGQKEVLASFDADLIDMSPAISAPKINSVKFIETECFDGFSILQSKSSGKANIHVPSDFFTCKDCLTEMHDPNDRRHHYPFTNCTQCGPRYTLINSLPYDRKNTSMEEFPLCEDCQVEYENPLDRRFHAEPIACPICGPRLLYKSDLTTINDSSFALEACLQSLEEGEIVAVKGIGGYHLMCDAQNDLAIQALRDSKGRPDKPLAVMFPTRGEDELAYVRESLSLSEDEANLIRSPSRPIVLLKKKANKLSELISPHLNEMGAMLAYSPLHHLLLNKFEKPLVATSANISGEPVLSDNQEIEERLSHITQTFLHHNRQIARPADDSVYRTIANKPRPIRLGRGHSPIEVELPFMINEPLIAYGSHMKNTVALAWDNRLVVSPHIGDLDSPRSMEVFQSTINDLQKLYQVKAKSIACDSHPSYASTRWAKQSGLPLHFIQHHKAHASALVMEYWQQSKSSEEPWLIYTWDGTGYGDDNSIWGAEALYGTPGNWERVASFRPFHLPGGEKAGREPWRSAIALCWEEAQDWSEIPVEPEFLNEAWKLRINAPKTMAMGRIFDAASALTGIIQYASFEGQGPMLLEQKCKSLYETSSLPISVNSDGLFEANWASLIPEMKNTKKSVEERSTHFHSVIAHTLLGQTELLNEKYPIKNIGLSGGVFQNRKLTEYVMKELKKKGYNAFIAEQLPVNDAGISAGQIVEANMQNQNIKGYTNGR